MCIICVELSNNKLSSSEARRNLGEMRTVLDEEHVMEVYRKIWDKEDEEKMDVDIHWFEHDTYGDTD